MPNHYFDTKNQDGTNPLNLNKIQVVVAMEMGLEFPFSNFNKAVRIGLFADYGLLNRQMVQIKPEPDDLFIFDKQIPNDLSVNSIYETNYKRSTKTNSFFVGIKITFLFGSKQQICSAKKYSNYGRNMYRR
jgi:hypothetical protein